MKIAWVSTWSRVCGIADYSQALFPAVRLALARMGHEAELFSLDEYQTPARLLGALKEFSPQVVHFQHEYGIYGGKNPPRYSFPRLVKATRRRVPGVRIAATAHTVLDADYEFPLKGRGLQRSLRGFANRFLLDSFRKIWGPDTWGPLDGVIVHSSNQQKTVLETGTRRVEVIPHFVFRTKGLKGTVSRTAPVLPQALSKIPADAKVVLVFGFFTPEKGQDVAIQAFSEVRSRRGDLWLVLAGGVRRREDQPYYDSCMAAIGKSGITDRVITTGFIDKKNVDAFYARADLVLAPFRETSGSGSLAQAFARGAAVLASDLPLNLEINTRRPGTLAFFKSADAGDCAREIERLLANETALETLRLAAQQYAEDCGPENTAEAHARFYEALVNS